jgi:toxin ParE1/3/4
MYKVIITETATEDLISILEYTFKKFGEAQLEKYKFSIQEQTNLLAISPKLGHKRDDIPLNCLALKVGSHFLIYRIENQIIFILRILHQRMDFSLRLKF